MRALAVLDFLLFWAICVTPFAWLAAQTQTGRTRAANECPQHPRTIRAMHDCYRPLLVFAPSLDDPQLRKQLQDMESSPEEMKHREVLYVPIVPEGHNQPIPGSTIPTATLSEDELAATRRRFKVGPEEFRVVLLGKDGGAKITSKSPISMEELESTIDSMATREGEMRENPEGDG